jgi:uncharacterized protein YndB with AHSA1/START domain/DNA-binding transcriptional ArsR family regulator
VIVDAALLAALAEPNRLRIIELLAAAPRPVGEIADALGLRQPQATKHLQLLERAGLVHAHPLGRRRVYSLRRAPFGDLADWAARLRGPEVSEQILQEYARAITDETERLAHDPGPRTVRLRRSVPAAPAAVWRAWTDPGIVSRWWSPQHFSVADCTVRAVPGGELVIVMAEGDGSRHRASGRFTVVEPPARLDFDLAPEDSGGRPLFRAAYAVRFEPAEDGTVILLRIRADQLSPDAAAAFAGLRFGWQQMLDKLVALLR